MKTCLGIICIVVLSSVYTDLMAQIDPPADSSAVNIETTAAAAADSVQTTAAATAADSVQTAAAAAAADSVAAGDVIKALRGAPSQIVWSISTPRIVWTILTIILAFIFIKFLTSLLNGIAERWTYIRLTVKGIIPVLRIVIWMVVIYTIITEILALPMQTLVALGASAGIAVGFASQDILKNIFGGIVILFDRPFQVGDKINASGYYGEVIHIGLRSVRIVTPDDNVVSIPNGELMNEAVSNANMGESNCQVVTDFFLNPDVDLDHAKKIAYMAAIISRYVYLKKPVWVEMKHEMSANRAVVKMRVKAYVLDIRHEAEFGSDITEIVLHALAENRLIAPA